MLLAIVVYIVFLVFILGLVLDLTPKNTTVQHDVVIDERLIKAKAYIKSRNNICQL